MLDTDVDAAPRKPAAAVYIQGRDRRGGSQPIDRALSGVHIVGDLLIGMTPLVAGLGAMDISVWLEKTWESAELSSLE